MRTGIQFFDDQEFQEGDLVVVLGGTASGKTTLATNLAVGLARNIPVVDGKPERHVTHFDLERPTLAWKAQVDQLSDGQGLPIEYRNRMDSAGWLPSELGRNAVVLDPVGLAAHREHIHGFAQSAKQQAVWQRTTVVLTAQLERSLWHELEREGWVDPKKLPEWVLEFADQIYYLRRTGVGTALVRVKGEGLAHGPHVTCTMAVPDPGAPLVQTGASSTATAKGCPPAY